MIDSESMRAACCIFEIYLDGSWRGVNGVIWRSQFDQCISKEHALLDMIELSGIPCVNSVKCIRNYGSRIAGYAKLLRVGVPMVPAEWFMGCSAIAYFHRPQFPVVMKVGNWHMGYGKMRIVSEDAWVDAVDMAAISREHVGIEPYFEWESELRCLLIGNTVVGIRRNGSHWKTNVCPDSVEEVNVPSDVERWTRIAANAMKADILGIDWLKTRNGGWVAIEVNLAPGLDFPWRDYQPYLSDILFGKLESL